MRFASCAAGERRSPAWGGAPPWRPLRDVAELGRETPAEVLADPPLTDERIALREVRLLPVVPHPGKVICLGLNYAGPVDECFLEAPASPTMFPKFTETLIGAGDPILLPPESSAPDFEAELA